MTGRPPSRLLGMAPCFLCLQEEYGNCEFAACDLDGYLIAFGSSAP